MELDKMRAADLAAVAELERASFSDAWSPAMLAGHLNTPGGMGLVCREGTGIAGYLLAFGGGTGDRELYRIACRESMRRRGVGTALMTRWIEEARADGAQRLFLEVREQNAAARALYERFAFQTAGLRRRYYRNPTDNAVCYRLDLSDVKKED